MTTILRYPHVFIFLILSSVSPSRLFSQELLYSVQQVEGSNEGLLKILDMDPQFTEPYAYVFHFKPLTCPRCEGIINPMIGLLKKQDSSVATLLVIAYSQKKAVITYLNNRNFRANSAFIDTSGLLNNEFHFSPEDLKVPFFYKINRKTGDLLFSTPLLGIDLNETLIRRILDDTIPESKFHAAFTIQAGSEIEKSNIETQDQLNFQQFIPFRETPDHTISNPLSFAVSEDGAEINFIDELSSSVFVFDSTGNFMSSMNVTEKEQTIYASPQVPKEILSFLIQSNILNVIYLRTNDLKQHGIVNITSSLPNVKMENDETVGYNNEICFLTKNYNNEILACDTLEISKVPVPFSLKHTASVFLNDFILVPVFKGWPARGTTQLDITNDAENPFLDSFYNYTPLFAAFSLKGEFIRMIGTIPDIYGELHTGYYLYGPKATENDDYFIISDGLSGEISLYPKNETLSSSTTRILHAFYPAHFSFSPKKETGEIYSNEKSNSLLSPSDYYKQFKPSNGNEFGYLESLSKNFGAFIMSMKMFQNNLYVLIKNHDSWTLRIFSDDFAHIKDYSINSDFQFGKKMVRCDLKIMNNGLILMSFLKTTGGFEMAKIRLVDLNSRP